MVVTLFNKAHFALYGLGWMLQEYAGRKIVSHTGGVNGFVTSVCLIPEEKTGIIVLHQYRCQQPIRRTAQRN
jgi:hypothetical protein